MTAVSEPAQAPFDVGAVTTNDVKHPVSAVNGVKHPVSAVNDVKHPVSAVNGVKHPVSAVNGVKHPVSAANGGGAVTTNDVKHPVSAVNHGGAVTTNDVKASRERRERRAIAVNCVQSRRPTVRPALCFGAGPRGLTADPKQALYRMARVGDKPHPL